MEPEDSGPADPGAEYLVQQEPMSPGAPFVVDLDSGAGYGYSLWWIDIITWRQSKTWA